MRTSLASLTALVAAGAAAGLALSPRVAVAQTASQFQPLAAVAAPAAAKGASFKIVSEDGGEGRAGVSVRLAARVSEAEIRRIADGLIAKRRAASGRVVVRFYLDGMALDQAPWAVATYQSDLKIAIGGLKLEEEELYLSELRSDRRQILGAWLTSPPAVPGRLAIIRDKGKVFAEWRLRNGLKTVDELEESRVTRGRRYDVKGETASHFLVTAAGVLELREADKLIAVAERIAPEKIVPNAAGHAPVAQSAPPLPQHGLPAATQPSALHPLPAAAPAQAHAPALAPARVAAEADDADAIAKAAPITAAAPKPQAKKRVARPQPQQKPVQSAARDNGPVMRLQGQ